MRPVLWAIVASVSPLCTATAHAQALEALDPAFGTGGIATTAIGPSAGDEDAGYGLAIQPSDGKLVVVGTSKGDFAVARYNTDGSLDTGFGTGGIVLTPMSANEAGSQPTDEAHAVAIQADGKIVVAGFANALPGSGGNGGDFAVARYNTNGSLDTGFDGDGKVITQPTAFSGPAFGVALQGTKIVVAGRATVASTYDFALVRYDSNGGLDAGFDGDGKLTTDVGESSNNDEANAVAIDGNGKIVAAGYSNTGASGVADDFSVARYNTDGSLDSGFSGDGEVVTPISTQPTFNQDRINAIAIQSTDKIVAAGSSMVTPTDEFALARYNGDGSLDTGFDTDGKVTTSVSPIGNTSVAFAVALQGDGKIVAAGRANNSDGFNFHQDFGLARYNTNGSLDTGFDLDGMHTMSVAPDAQVDLPQAVAVQGDGKIVAAGLADMGPTFIDYDFALARYLPTGDQTAPQTTINSGPSGTTSETTPTFTFSSTEVGSTFACRVDSGATVACSSPYTTNFLPDGPHSFEVRASDPDRNLDPTPDARAFTVSTFPGVTLPPSTTSPGSAPAESSPSSATKKCKKGKGKKRKKCKKGRAV
jgi:uncharacterized delta-60 repeat protein